MIDAGALKGASVGEVVSRWGAGEGLCACVSGGTGAVEWSRRSVLASPSFVREIALGAIDPADPLNELREAVCSTSSKTSGGGWIVGLSYDLGRLIEERAGSDGGAVDDRSAPAMILARYEGALVHDALTREWRVEGDAGGVPALEEVGRDIGFVCDGIESSTGRTAYEDGVRLCVELIHSGDAFQVNLAHRLTGRYKGDPRGLFRACLEHAQPWYGALIESNAHTLVSMSPELFVSLDRETGRVVTRPIKGTRPSARIGELAASEKDRAELVMIVDLMRNDIGRVCEIGSVRVREGRAVELHGGEHGGVSHGVATVEGVLSEGEGVVDLLCATFPPGSVTGAPKIRAMQIIDELEPVRRGFYCGSIGVIRDDGDATFNVAIRTATLTREGRGGVLDYPVGAGIVADSEAAAEWEETLHKADAFRNALHRCSGETLGVGS